MVFTRIKNPSKAFELSQSDIVNDGGVEEMKSGSVADSGLSFIGGDQGSISETGVRGSFPGKFLI